MPFLFIGENQLLSAVAALLDNIPTYYMSLFLIPKNVLKQWSKSERISFRRGIVALEIPSLIKRDKVTQTMQLTFGD